MQPSKRVNDPDVRVALAVWFKRLAEEQQKAERKVKRPAETGLGPLQNTLMGLSGCDPRSQGSAGTIAAPVAALVFPNTWDWRRHDPGLDA